MAFTFFFRDNHTLEQVTKHLMPRVAGSSKINIWDAGCAMGQEPYTFAIILAEKMGYFSFKNVTIDASDIDENETFGTIITNGIYPMSELTRIPEEIFKKYFQLNDQNNNYKIIDQIKTRIHFIKHDLLTLKPFGGNYHLIICKNVLLHFSPEERIKVYTMYHSCLTDGGLLVTEQTQHLPADCNHLFEQIATDANIYQKI